jgi:hypothetical protein
MDFWEITDALAARDLPAEPPRKRDWLDRWTGWVRDRFAR